MSATTPAVLVAYWLLVAGCYAAELAAGAGAAGATGAGAGAGGFDSGARRPLIVGRSFRIAAGAGAIAAERSFRTAAAAGVAGAPAPGQAGWHSRDSGLESQVLRPWCLCVCVCVLQVLVASGAPRSEHIWMCKLLQSGYSLMALAMILRRGSLL